MKETSGSIHAERLPDDLSVDQVLRVFSEEPFLMLFDSAASAGRGDSRYSFLTADPVQMCRVDNCEFGQDPLRRLREWQSCLPSGDQRELPGFCGGIAGLMSYDLRHAFEKLMPAEPDSFATPALLAGLFDWAIVWDHHRRTVMLYVLSLPVSFPEERLRQVRRRLRCAGAPAMPDGPTGRRPVPFQSSFDEHAYLQAVQRVLDYIAAGDIFQASLSQKLTAAWDGSAVDLYARVRRLNAAPFCGLLKVSEFAVVSASPERFLKVRPGGLVETRPIKGTRRRQRLPIADLYAAEELAASGKDRAENVMIVDLLRNDISRVCQTGSVQVTGVCEIEVFETVQHLVSTVVGTLRADRDVWDLCAACFPGGSVTGAPKIRAMEIITELEQRSRGAYCGSLFCLGPSGEFDSSILIRTFTLRDGQVCFPVGGGIVADSVPRREFEETLHKAAGMLRCLDG